MNPKQPFFSVPTPLKFDMAPEKWWLVDYLPLEMVKFQGRAVKCRGCIQLGFILLGKF